MRFTVTRSSSQRMERKRSHILELCMNLQTVAVGADEDHDH